MRKFIAALVAGVAFASPASATSIVNGSFESGLAFTSAFVRVDAPNSTSITGWTVGGANVHYIGRYWQASDGNRSIDLAGNNIGSISQLLSTIAGQLYRVTFDVARNPDGGLNPRTGFVDVGGAQTTITYNNALSTRTNMMWEQRTYDFIASSAATTLRFSADPATSAVVYGLTLDNVSIAAVVPEPATWAMMVLGFGLVGSAARRRKQAVSFA